MNAQLCVTWESYLNYISKGFASFQQNEEFVDMTLAADGHLVKVHQNIVALASPYLKAMLHSAACPHPVIFLDKINHSVLVYVLEYIYTGEVKIPFKDINRFIEACQSLCIRGIETIAAPQIVNQHPAPQVVTPHKPHQGNVAAHIQLNTEGDNYKLNLITNDNFTNCNQEPVPVEIVSQNTPVTAPILSAQNDPPITVLDAQNVSLAPIVPAQSNRNIPFLVQSNTPSPVLLAQTNIPVQPKPAEANSNIDKPIEHSTENHDNISTEIATDDDVDMDNINYFLKLKSTSTSINTIQNTDKTEDSIKIVSDLSLNTKEATTKGDTDAISQQFKQPLCFIINANSWLPTPIANKTIQFIKPVNNPVTSIPNQPVIQSKPGDSSLSLTKKLKAVRIGPRNCPIAATENTASLNINNNSIRNLSDIYTSKEVQSKPVASSLQMEVENLMDEKESNITEEESEPIITVKQHVPKKSTNPVRNNDHNSKTPQYSISTRGSLQLILNRYVYTNHHLSKCGYKRRWRCIDYRGLHCPGYIDTNNDEIVVISGQHNHYYHDIQIRNKIINNQVFQSVINAVAATDSMEKTSSETEESDMKKIKK